MSQWIIPKWNQYSQQITQEQDATNRSSNVHFPHKTNPSFSHINLVPMPKYEATGMTWRSEEREAAVDGHGEVLLQTPSTKHLWGKSDDTLESLVHSSVSRKRPRSNPECKENETLMTWDSLESRRPSSFKTKNFIEDFAQDGGLEEEHNMKGKTDGSCSTRQTQAATTNHNQSKRRRERINQKMKDLQKLVPNGNKTDKASLLDDTIQYLKQLQEQVQFMYSIRSSTVPQMIMPLGIQQQQLQMSLLAAHMGLLHTDSMVPSSSSFPCDAGFPPPVLLPSITSTKKPKSSRSTRAFVLPTDPFCTFLAQSMDMDFYSKMVTLYCQEVNKTTQPPSRSIQSQRPEDIKEDVHQNSKNDCSQKSSFN